MRAKKIKLPARSELKTNREWCARDTYRRTCQALGYTDADKKFISTIKARVGKFFDEHYDFQHVLTWEERMTFEELSIAALIVKCNAGEA